MLIDPSLTAALDAHTRGWTPVPLRPARKTPALAEWPTLAFEEAERVELLWDEVGERYEGQPLNLGLALGATHGGLVDIDIDHPKALAVAARVLPHTPMRSGRPGNPGSHFWYRVEGYDPGIVGCKLPDGSMVIEFRAGGGQTAVPPSQHPDGDTYEWAGEPWGGEDGPRVLNEAEARGLHTLVLSIALCVTLADNWPKKGGRHAAYLPLVGGLLRDADEAGQPRCHPMWDANIEALIGMLVALTNDPDGARARVAEAVESTRRKIVRGAKVQGWPTLAGMIGEDHVAKAREYVEAIETVAGAPRAKMRRGTETGGGEQWYEDRAPLYGVADEDEQEETREEREVRLALLDDSDRDPLRERLSDWSDLDLGPYLRGGVRPPETGYLWRVSEQVDTETGEITEERLGLIYRHRVNTFYGASSSGKSLIALDMVRAAMEDGDDVMFIDFEDEPHGTLSRLLDMGMDPGVIDRRFAYVHPETQPLGSMQVDRWGQRVLTEPGQRTQEIFNEVVARRNPSLIVLDGTTSLYRIHGMNVIDNSLSDIVGSWLKRLAEESRTVLVIDHVAKSAKPGDGPLGAGNKVGMMTGVALHLHTYKRPRKGGTGSASIYVTKDRHSALMTHAEEDEPYKIADVTFDGTGDRLKIKIGAIDPDTIEIDNTDEARTAAGTGAGAKRGTAGRPPKWNTVTNQQHIVQVLRDAGRSMSAPEIKLATGLDMSVGTMRDILNHLVQSRALIREDNEWRSPRPDDVP